MSTICKSPDRKLVYSVFSIWHKDYILLYLPLDGFAVAMFHLVGNMSSFTSADSMMSIMCSTYHNGVRTSIMRADERMKAANLDDSPSHISVSSPQPAKSESEQLHHPEMHAGNMS